MKIRKIFINCLVVIVLFITAFFAYYEIGPKSIGADSGFDSSYDGGGSSGSDYGGSDYGWSGSDYGSSSNLSPRELMIVVGIFALIGLLMYLYPKVVEKIVVTKNRRVLASDEKDISCSYILNCLGNIDINRLKQDRYNQYISLQKAISNYDNNYLLNSMTSDLYKKYEVFINYLKDNDLKRMFDNLVCQGINITSIHQNGNLTFVTMFFTYRARDYLYRDVQVYLYGSDKVRTYQKEVLFVRYPNGEWVISDIKTRREAD